MMTRPLSGVEILDLGVGMAAALAVRLMADAGARVVRFEPAGGDPFYDVYPAYRFWQRGKALRTGGLDAILSSMREADICVIGGEASPGLEWRFDPEELQREAPRLVVLHMTATPPGAGVEDFPAVEILAQARSGMCFEQYADRPFVCAMPIASYGAAMHGATAALAALWSRAQTGRGDIVSASLLQGALRWAASIWARVERPPKSYFTLTPKSVAHFRLKCADGGYVQLAPNVPGGAGRLYRILGIDRAPPKPGAKGGLNAAANPRTFFGEVDALAPDALKWQRDDLVDAVREAEIPGAPVLRPTEVWDDPQTIHNGVIVADDAGWLGVGLPLRIEAGELPSASDSAQSARRFAGPLSGVRVVDFGCFAAGPHASVLLADLGADVVKIERIGGDPMRSGFHHYAASNRGKRSICIDAKAPEGADVIRRICAGADIVHHNFRPGVSQRMGVDRDSLKTINPDVIVLESSAYGATGPKSPLPGFDSVFQALCGHQPGAGGVAADPAAYRFAPMDYSTGVIGAWGMVLGMLFRQRSQRGVAIDASLLNSGVFMLSEAVRAPDGSVLGGRVNGPSQWGLHPAESLYRTSDGWVAIAARGEAMARRCAQVLGAAEACDTPYTEWNSREQELFATRLGALSTADALKALHRADVWATFCASDVGTVLDDPTLAEAGVLLSYRDDELGEVHQVGCAVHIASRGVPEKHLAPIDPLGAHTRDILSECGYGAGEIDALYARGVVA